MAKGDALGTRQLNRATLHRQHLLERSGGVVDTIENLVGMQAQNPHDPYFALWARIEPFQPEELSGLLVARSVVRAALMRGTIHLVTARDYLGVRPMLHSVLARVLGSTAFARDTAELDRDELLLAARQHLAEAPRTRAELAELLGERWPDYPATSLAQVASYLLPVVQIPPRGLWGESGAARWALAETWLEVPLEDAGGPDELVLRYLAAFGPASASDMRMWSGLAGLREVVERVRPRLRVWRDEKGAELFDLPDAVHPDPEVPAPPRFLPEYDNLLLGHADRSRFITGPTPEGWVGNLLVDGFYAGSWKRSGGTLSVTLRVKIDQPRLAEVEEEAHRLMAAIGAVAPRVEVRVEPS